jgi:hypothetical protein
MDNGILQFIYSCLTHLKNSNSVLDDSSIKKVINILLHLCLIKSDSKKLSLIQTGLFQYFVFFPFFSSTLDTMEMLKTDKKKHKIFLTSFI